MTARRLLLAITTSRVVFAAGFAMAVLLGSSVLLPPLALLVELSDVSDGRFARRTGNASVVGNVYDGMADHLARMTEFVCLASIGALGLLPVLVFLWRDGVVVTTRLVTTLSGGDFPATRLSGKAKGIAQGACIVWLSTTQAIPSLGADAPWLSPALVWTAAAVTALSAVDYATAFRGSAVAVVRR